MDADTTGLIAALPALPGLPAAPEAAALAGLLAGLVAGALAVWLMAARPLGRAARAAVEERIAAERALAAAEVRSERAQQMAEEIGRLQAALADAHAEGASLEGTLEAERRAQETRLEDMVRAEARLSERFEALAAETLGTNAARFLDMASARQATQAAEGKATLEALVSPLADTLTRFETRLGELERAREGAYHALRQQVASLAEGHDSLRGETARLVRALSAPKTRGRWGEMQLARVLEMAGMTEHVDWVAERGHRHEDGTLRPDVVVRMPGGRSLVIDAKTPLDAYLELVAATGAEARRAAEAAHARQVRAQVQALSAKAYWRLIEGAPDFVVMFLPGEGIHAAALEADPALMEDAYRRRVLIATPTTLIALLRSVAHGWQQARIDANAREIQAAARLLYDRLGTLGGHLDDLGRALGQAVERHNRAVGSFEGRVLPAARRFEALGISAPETVLEAPAMVESAPRGVTAPETAGETARHHEQGSGHRPGAARAEG